MKIKSRTKVHRAYRNTE